ncbi:hypothetical protein ACFPRL_02290 [Pseudoclavibacter helvolus]
MSQEPAMPSSSGCATPSPTTSTRLASSLSLTSGSRRPLPRATPTSSRSSTPCSGWTSRPTSGGWMRARRSAVRVAA